MTYTIGQNVRATVIGFDLLDLGREEPVLVVRTDENDMFKSYWIKWGNQISCTVNFNGRTVGIGAKRFENKIPSIIRKFECDIDKSFAVQVAVLYTFKDEQPTCDNVIPFKRR